MRKILSRLLIPVVAAAMLAFAVYPCRPGATGRRPSRRRRSSRRGRRSATPWPGPALWSRPTRPAAPPPSPSARRWRASSSGSPCSIGEEVKAGDLLVELDKRQAEAQLAVNQAQVSVAQATERQAADAYRRDLATTREAVSDQQRIADEEAWRLAQAQKKVADAAVRQAQTALDLLEIRAPSAGTILQVNVRPGEYVSVLGGTGLVLMGNLHPLHVRVDIDENDAPALPQGGAGAGQPPRHAGSFVSAKVRSRGAVCRAEEVADRGQHRAGGHAGPGGHLFPRREGPADLRRPADGRVHRRRRKLGRRIGAGA